MYAVLVLYLPFRLQALIRPMITSGSGLGLLKHLRLDLHNESTMYHRSIYYEPNPRNFFLKNGGIG